MTDYDYVRVRMDCDTIFCILSWLKLRDILNSGLINKQFNTISKNELLWKRLCDNEYPDAISNNYHMNYEKYHSFNTFLIKHDRFRTLKQCSPKSNFVKISINFGNLSLHNSRLHGIPAEIGLLTNLCSLDISNNDLQSIPKEIGFLTNLMHLNIHMNKLKSLPNEIGSLIELEELQLHDNHLRTIPKEISLLTKLKRLDLEQNPLKSIPNEISLLTNLSQCYFDISKVHLISEEAFNVNSFSCGTVRLSNKKVD
jgi:Leucine-rich repeat (LRR) protein